MARYQLPLEQLREFLKEICGETIQELKEETNKINDRLQAPEQK